MNIGFILNFFLYLSIVIIVGAILLRIKKKYRLHIPIIVAVLLFLSSFLGLRSHDMLNMETYYLKQLIAARMGGTLGRHVYPSEVGDGAVDFVLGGANLTLYFALLVIAVVCIAAVVESMHIGIRHLRKKRRQRKAAA